MIYEFDNKNTESIKQKIFLTILMLADANFYLL